MSEKGARDKARAGIERGRELGRETVLRAGWAEGVEERDVGRGRCWKVMGRPAKEAGKLELGGGRRGGGAVGNGEKRSGAVDARRSEAKQWAAGRKGAEQWEAERREAEQC